MGGSEEGVKTRNWWKVINAVTIVLILVVVFWGNFVQDTFGNPRTLISYGDMINKYGVSVNLTGEASQVEAQQIFTILKKLNEKYNPRKSVGIYSNVRNLFDMKIESKEKGIVYVTLDNVDSPVRITIMNKLRYTFERTWIGRWKVTDAAEL
jgi:hypothetical protein